MLTLIASLTLLTTQTELPGWIQNVLDATPSTPTPVKSPSPSPEQLARFYAKPSSGEHRHGIEMPVVKGSGTEDPALPAKRIDKLVSNGLYDAAYHASLAAYPNDRLDPDSERLAYTALLAGHADYLERLLVRYIRGSNYSSGTNGIFFDQLSYATAVQGQLYPGQGLFALNSVKKYLAIRGIKYKGSIPIKSYDVAKVSLLSIGLKLPPPYDRVCLRRVLEQDPGSETAVEAWMLRDDGSQPDVTIRIVKAMVDRLPAGEGHDRYERLLASLQSKRAPIANSATGNH